MARYNNDISQIRQQAIFGQPQQQNMTRGVLNLDDLIDRSTAQPGSDQDAFKNYNYGHDIDHSGDSWQPSDANPREGSFEPTTTRPGATDKGLTSSRIEDLVKMVNQVYTPETRAGNRFNDLLDNAPERNKPGLMRALVAGTTAFGANAKGMDIQNISDRVMYAPYIRDMAEWKEKATPYQQAAQLENTANSNERTLAGNLVNNWTTGERNAETARYNEGKLAESTRAAQAREEIQRGRNAILSAQGVKFETRGKNVIATYPPTAEYPDGRVIDTGVPTTAFSPFELANLNNGSRERINAATNTAAGQRNDATNASREAQGAAANTSREAAARTRAEAVTGRTPATMTPAQEKQDMINRQQKVYNDNPKWQEFFDLNPDNTVSLIPPIDTGWGIPGWSNSKEKVTEYWKAYKAVNPGAEIPDEFNADLQAGGSQAYQYFKDPVNPTMRWRRTRDGVNFEITHDGGKTWSVSRDR